MLLTDCLFCMQREQLGWEHRLGQTPLWIDYCPIARNTAVKDGRQKKKVKKGKKNKQWCHFWRGKKKKPERLLSFSTSAITRRRLRERRSVASWRLLLRRWWEGLSARLCDVAGVCRLTHLMSRVSASIYARVCNNVARRQRQQLVLSTPSCLYINCVPKRTATPSKALLQQIQSKPHVKKQCWRDKWEWTRPKKCKNARLYILTPPHSGGFGCFLILHHHICGAYAELQL